MTREEIKRLPFVVKTYQKIYSYNSTCGICCLPWSVAEHHDVKLTEELSCFAVCEYCWEKATLEQVLEAHTKAYYDVISGLPEDKRESFLKGRSLIDLLMKVQDEYNNTH